ncbi:MAG: efflux RND transporter periplasmic adaptor subunit [Nitrospirota bacterium]|nr:efflux RND transporter periplasmic adaptor subunit [Nitrospirota bacterium]MDE3243365.1 efflux RND transporter periplasmic adaptor subunit [Nitrospirota bacterium]
MRSGSPAAVLFVALALSSFVGVAVSFGGELNCLIEPHVAVTVTAPVGGLITSVEVDRGDLVKEGQVLAMLDSSLERAVGSINHAQAELTNKQMASLELQRTNAEIALRTIRSPINGVVVERLMHPGEFTKQERLFRLAQLDPLRVEVFAPAALHGKVTVGMHAQVRPEAPATGVYSAKVTVVDRVIDAASGTFGIRLQLPNPDYKLPAGLKCTVRFP